MLADNSAEQLPPTMIYRAGRHSKSVSPTDGRVCSRCHAINAGLVKSRTLTFIADFTAKIMIYWLLGWVQRQTVRLANTLRTESDCCSKEHASQQQAVSVLADNERNDCPDSHHRKRWLPVESQKSPARTWRVNAVYLPASTAAARARKQAFVCRSQDGTDHGSQWLLRTSSNATVRFAGEADHCIQYNALCRADSQVCWRTTAQRFRPDILPARRYRTGRGLCYTSQTAKFQCSHSQHQQQQQQSGRSMAFSFDGNQHGEDR